MKPLRFLLIRFSSIGDVLLCEPVPRLLKEEFPGCRVEFVTRANVAEIVEGWPAIDAVHCPEEPAALADLRLLKKQLKTETGGRVIDLHNNLRSRALFPGLARRYPKSRLQKWGLVYLPAALHPLFPKAPPVWRRYQTFAGIPAARQQKARLVVAGEPLTWASGQHTDTEILVPGAGRLTKSWPSEYWKTFLKNLLEHTTGSIEVLGGRSEETLGNELCELAPERIHNFCGQLSLSESARHIAQGRRILVGDTGLLHMADAAGIPGIALYGSTTRELGFFPAGSQLKVLEVPLNCRPCSHVGRSSCPKGHFRCMLDLGPDWVLENYLQQ